ncbi:hypothetical protein [Sphingomonas sp. RS2018]
MHRAFAIIAATAGILVGTAATANTPKPRAFDPITASYQPKTGKACIRTGWGHATNTSNRLVRQGDCHDVAAWRQRGIAFDVPKQVTTSVEIAAR